MAEPSETKFQSALLDAAGNVIVEGIALITIPLLEKGNKFYPNKSELTFSEVRDKASFIRIGTDTPHKLTKLEAWGGFIFTPPHFHYATE